jgi:pimeloyl-ACP methyl ester carboxylesterase
VVALQARGVPTYRLPERVQEYTIAIDGLPVRVLQAGTGFPVLLLHGLGDWANTWHSTLDALSNAFLMIAPDLPGHGLSGKEVPDYSAEWYLSFAGRLVAELGLGAFAVVGESAGGLLAAMLALAMQSRVRALGLVGSAGLGREVSWTLRLASMRVLNRAITIPSRKLVRAFSRSLFYDPALVTEDWVNLHFHLWFREGVRETVLRLAQKNLSLLGQKIVLLERLDSLTAPVAAFWGRHDRVIPVEHAYRLKAVRPASRLYVYDRCGHMPQWEKPVAFNSDLAEFLNWAVSSGDY